MKPAQLPLILIIAAIGLTPSLSLADETPLQTQGEAKAKTWTEPITGMKFVWIEGGCFQMGQLPLETRLLKREVGQYDYEKYYADELPRHKVCLNGFWMGATEVTQKEWVKIMGFNPAHFNTNENFPVDTVSCASRRRTRSGSKMTTANPPSSSGISTAGFLMPGTTVPRPTANGAASRSRSCSRTTTARPILPGSISVAAAEGVRFS